MKRKKRPLKTRDYFKRIGVVAALIFLLYQLWIVLHIVWWIYFNPTSSAFMEQRLVVLQQTTKPSASLQYQWVDYPQISGHLKRAVIASEDAKFTQHGGVDWKGIQYALEKNIKKGKVVAGGSTITQQLAKNMFLSSKRTPWRKGEELLIAYMFELILSKQRIFEIYLNVIEWGNGVFGAQAAAEHYFKSNASHLNQYQSAKLAAMIPNPRYYDKHRNTARLRQKTQIIVKRMPSSIIPQ